LDFVINLLCTLELDKNYTSTIPVNVTFFSYVFRTKKNKMQITVLGANGESGIEVFKNCKSFFFFSNLTLFTSQVVKQALDRGHR
jgi:hypothetical protein